MFIIADLGNAKFEFLLCSTKETHEVYEDSSNSKEEARKIKVVEEQERCKQILEGYIKLKEQLPPTLCKTTALYMERREEKVNNLEAKLDQLNTICINLNIELEHIKK
ncbi:11746_t:CDS:2 [Gigaspora margarita]|uniref:11746_t:CDS:1 n=1 Tax=Gigaspora margarita TaxID=4874 RepID=A0ABN7UND2_GIGMA|nr:11746_t:CDS:2 [Gigaspora margarita]